MQNQVHKLFYISKKYKIGEILQVLLQEIFCSIKVLFACLFVYIHIHISSQMLYNN